jgi:hypothetical protein
MSNKEYQMSRVIGTKTNGDVIWDDSDYAEIDNKSVQGMTFMRYELTTRPQLIKKFKNDTITIKPSYYIGIWSERQ